ncbi:MAG: hypothetical protein FDZ69_08320 [Deltaproteobacteria bacterium]|nr:MAG: hypothetical protein FDZ69_08320 [Deltaproteobacteria bacterium]
MNAHHSHHLPSIKQLVVATGMAGTIAVIILLTAVLPAEYGIDPTGIGKALRLTTLSAPKVEAPANVSVAVAPQPVPVAPPAVAQTQSVTVAKSALPLRSDEMTLTLQPSEGVEVKASMRKGEQFVFNWTVEGGKVNFDMHGEPPGKDDKFTSYWKATQQTEAQGTFVAPFDGTHGWFWRNRGDHPVTVKLKVSGFYEKIFKK